VAAQKLTPVSGVSAKANPAATLTAQRSGDAASIRARGRPDHRRLPPCHARPLTGVEGSLQQPGGKLSRGAGVGVRVLAIGDEAVRQFGHVCGDVGVQVKHTEDRKPVGTGQRPDAGQDFALHVGAGLGDHGAVQHEEDCVQAAGQRGRRPRLEFAPEGFQHGVLHRRARRGAEVHRGQDFPAVIAGRLQRAPKRRAVAGTAQQLPAEEHLAVGQAGRSVQKRVRFMEQSGEKDALGHGHALAAGGGGPDRFQIYDFRCSDSGKQDARNAV
jgi:hypothetical protein